MTILGIHPIPCSRQPCRRCATKEAPKPPTPVDHQVGAQPPGPEVTIPRAIAARLRQVEGDLAADAGPLAKDLGKRGPTVWSRVQDWVAAGHLPARGVRGGGSGIKSDQRAADEREARQAAGYQAEINALTDRLMLSPTRNDVARLHRIVGIVCPAPAKSLADKHRQQAQVAAEGWCVNCWKHDGHLTPITLRPAVGDQLAAPWYRDLCRPCGQWRGEHGQLPPLGVLEVWHAGKRLTTAVAERAMART